jgi:hypothetical protein
MLHAHHMQLRPLELCGWHRPTSSFMYVARREFFFIVGHKEISIDVRIFIRRTSEGEVNLVQNAGI